MKTKAGIKRKSKVKTAESAGLRKTELVAVGVQVRQKQEQVSGSVTAVQLPLKSFRGISRFCYPSMYPFF